MTAQATFGRDSAMFEGLLGFVAQLSLVLWSLVIVTAVFRSVGIWIYRRGAALKARDEAASPIAALPAGPVETPPVKAATAVPVKVRKRTTRPEARVPAFATNSGEA